MGFCLTGFMGSFCPSVLPLPLLQYMFLFFILNKKFHFPAFPFISSFLLFVGLPLNVKSSLVSLGSIYIIIGFLPPYTPRYHQTLYPLCFQMKKCDFAYLSIWNVHCFVPSSSVRMLKVFHFDWCNVRKILLSLSRK